MNENIPRYPLASLCFSPHFFGAEKFETQRNPDFYTPHILKKAYRYPETQNATGTKIAIISAFDDGEVIENLKAFTEEFDLEMPVINLYYPDGKPQGFSRSWQIETALDTQWLTVFAPKAEIDVIFAKTALLDDMISAVRFALTLKVDAVAMCFGTTEFASQRNLSILFEDTSCIFVASSGDIGGVVQFPSSSPYVLSVGGTQLLTDATGNILSETVWQNSGGGKSVVFEMPSFQKNFVPPEENMRSLPDIAFSADHLPGVAVYISSLGGWTNAGGTSLGCACVTGICTLIKKHVHGISSTREIQDFLYSKAGVFGYNLPQLNFNDIIIGQSGSFTAKQGWDFCTGLGSMKMDRFFKN